MSETASNPGPRDSLSAVIEQLATTAVEIGRSLTAAGQGLLQTALRLYESFASNPSGAPTSEPRGAGSSTSSAPSSDPRASTSSGGTKPARSSVQSSAIALDAEAALAAGREAAEETARRVARARETTPHEALVPLPERYDIDRLVVVPRDPGVLFAYWEVRDATRARIRSQLESGGSEPAHEALRVEALDGTTGRPEDSPGSGWTIDLAPFASSSYIDVGRPNQRFRVTLGVISGGRFSSLIAPAEVTTPPAGVSPERGVRWATAGQAAAVPAQASGPPAELSERLMAHAHEANAASSPEWPPGHRLLELDFGGSHNAPRS